MLELRRLRRPTLFDTDWEKPAPLIPRSLRFESDERIDARGHVLQALSEGQVDALVRHLEELDVEAVAVAEDYDSLLAAVETEPPARPLTEYRLPRTRPDTPLHKRAKAMHLPPPRAAGG